MSFKRKINLKPDREYIILRFVAWNATHDEGQSGLSDQIKNQLVHKLSDHYKIFISSEYPLQQELEKFKNSFTPDQVHDALFHAKLLISEGTTMAMEAAVLGTPSVYINSLKYSNVADMEGYGLINNFYNEDRLVEKILSLASDDSLKNRLQEKRHKMLKNKVMLF